MSHSPSRQLFMCVEPASCGGEWHIADGRRVARDLGAEFLAAFAARGLRYERRFIKGFDVDWSRFFDVATLDEAVKSANAKGFEASIEDGEVLRISLGAPAVIHDVVADAPVWFNQVLLHLPAAVPSAIYVSMKKLFGEDRFPRTVAFGDGTPIGPEHHDAIERALAANASVTSQREGDVLVLNNLLFAHGRLPYRGRRIVRVALGDAVATAELPRFECLLQN